jgi:hypothetical protein
MNQKKTTALTTRCTGEWAEDEDSKLKDAVHTHGDKKWGAIAELVPGRTADQCWRRWKYVLDPSIDRANGRTAKWAEHEDSCSCTLFKLDPVAEAAWGVVPHIPDK